MKAFFREFLITFVIAAVIALAWHATIQTFVIFMTSMTPTFQEGQRLLVNKASYFFGEPERGDVIVFDKGRNGDYIKRIIALPGDNVEIKEGAVYINDSRLDEPYIKNPPIYTIAEREIPDNMYFVLGDNRNNSDDSHNNWLVARDNIIGKAWLSIWPIDRWDASLDYPLQEQLTGS
ncbi:signal peptidase I [Chloroflexota bacterium]